MFGVRLRDEIESPVHGIPAIPGRWLLLPPWPDSAAVLARLARGDGRLALGDLSSNG